MHRGGTTMPSRRLTWRWSGNHRWQQNSTARSWTSSSARASPRQTVGGIVSKQVELTPAINPDLILWNRASTLDSLNALFLRARGLQSLQHPI